MEDIKKDIRRIHNDLVDIKVELATLKVKSGFWGAAGALLLLLPTLVIFLITK